MATIDMLVGQTILLNATAFSAFTPSTPIIPIDQQPQIPLIPLSWTSSNHAVVEFLNANHDRTQIQIKALSPGTSTIGYTDTSSNASPTLTISVSLVPKATTLDNVLKVDFKELPVNSGDTGLTIPILP